MKLNLLTKIIVIVFLCISDEDSENIVQRCTFNMTLLLCVYENYYTKKDTKKVKPLVSTLKLFIYNLSVHCILIYLQTANQSTSKHLAQVISSCDDLKNWLGEDVVQLVKCFTDKKSAECCHELHGLSEVDPLHDFFTKGWF